MDGVKESLTMIKKKQQLFKQQQFTFIAALERSREHAHHRGQPVSRVTEVQRYMIHHCSHATDQRIFALFLDIMANLNTAFQMIETVASAQNHSSEVMDTCRNVLSADYDFSQLKAHYMHEEVNRLSCNEAQNYYGGVVSIIPLALDLLSKAIMELAQANRETGSQKDTMEPEQHNAEKTSGNVTKKPHVSTQSFKPVCKGAAAWKPAWKPPGP